MTLIKGTHLGVYEISGPVGAGGMGEVYRAFDPRLKREVAIKVLPDAPSPDCMARLEQEARVAGSLNHPHIVTVFDIGVHDGHPFVVLELLQGETLRGRLSREPVRSASDGIHIAVQIARGLAAAHDKGIVHRDLKPENVFIVDGGHVKILDFGLAQRRPIGGAESETYADVRTETGVTLGTPAYMSPEQVRGATLDTRSDLFTFGIILYELFSGRNPFRRDTSAESLAAILNDEPPGLPGTVRDFSPAIARIVGRCLHKRPEDRFQSASDLAFALQSLSSTTPIDAAPVRTRSVWKPLGVAAAVLAAVLAAVSGVWLMSRRNTEPPTFEQLSFRRGWVGSARFGPDGATIVYGGAFEAEPPTIYTGRIGSRESRSLDLPSGLLLGVSPSSDLAIAIGSTQLNGSGRKAGTLARVPLAGGAPREVEGSVLWADWGPDGNELALVRQLRDGRRRLEYPAGHSIEERSGEITYIRVSPRGDRIAYFAYSPSSNVGSLAVVDRSGLRVTLADHLVWPMGLVWDPGGESIWFTAGDGTGTSSIHVTTLTGVDRIVYRTPGYLTLQDRSSDGRLLVTRDDWRVESIAKAPGSSEERDVSWLDVSNVADITDDGIRIAIVDLGVGAGSKIVSYLRGTDGSPAIRLSEGAVSALSPDGTRAVVQFPSDPQPTIRIVPTGPGDSVPLNANLPANVAALGWYPRGNQVIATAAEKDQPARCYLADLDSGTTRAVTPAATSCNRGAASPDGQFVLASDSSGAVAAYPIAGGEPRPLRSLESGETTVRWSADGQSIFVRQEDGVSIRVTRIGFADGQRQALAVLGPRDKVGVTGISGVALGGDGSAYTYSFLRHTSTLFLVSGLR